MISCLVLAFSVRARAIALVLVVSLPCVFVPVPGPGPGPWSGFNCKFLQSKHGMIPIIYMNLKWYTPWLPKTITTPQTEQSRTGSQRDILNRTQPHCTILTTKHNVQISNRNQTRWNQLCSMYQDQWPKPGSYAWTATDRRPAWCMGHYGVALSGDLIMDGA